MGPRLHAQGYARIVNAITSVLVAFGSNAKLMEFLEICPEWESLNIEFDKETEIDLRKQRSANLWGAYLDGRYNSNG